MPENEPLRFEWKGIWHLWFTTKALLSSSKAHRPTEMPSLQARYSPLNTKREVETIPTGHSLVLTVACFQAEGQRHLTISGAWDRARGPRYQDRDPRIKRAEGGRKC